MKPGKASPGMKKLLCTAAALLLALTLTGCSQFTESFGNYDVSGYIKALLDSSYLGDNSDYVALANTTSEDAQTNNSTTVENGAVIFCNKYSIYPSDEQLAKLESVMERAYKLSRYTVMDEVRTETGYTIDVIISPMTVFTSHEQAFKEAEQRQEEAYNKPLGSTAASEDSLGNEDESANSQNESSGSLIMEGYDYIDDIIDICDRALNDPQYADSVTITLNIPMDDGGALSLDTTQIEIIDRTVINMN